MSILADITRCWDAGCPERTACRRWLERDSGTVHAQSLFPYDEDIGSRCSLRIPPIITETMSNNDHPITPPQELVKQWWAEETYDPFGVAISRLATQAARWGWDQRNETIEAELQEARDVELEGCCEWVRERDGYDAAWVLRADRRPKPPSLKEQACDALDTYIYGNPDPKDKERTYNTIRRALEALDD